MILPADMDHFDHESNKTVLHVAGIVCWILSQGIVASLM